MKILVIGSDGMLGQDVVSEFQSDHELICSTIHGAGATIKLDITSLEDTVAVVEQSAADLVVNCAAYTAVDKCETERDLALKINGGGAGNIAVACAQQGRRLFHISTDYVFDGEKDSPYVEDDLPCPRSVYGETKLAGESAVMAAGGEWYMGRIQWLYGAGGPNFAETILRLANEKSSLKVVDDQIGCPTWTVEVARCMRRIVEEGELGLYHMTAKGATTWYGFTKAILAAAGKEGYPVEPCTTDEFPRPAHRPRNSALRNRHLEQTIGDTMLPWNDVVEDYLRSRNS